MSSAFAALIAWARTGRLERPESATGLDEWLSAATAQRMAPLLYAAVADATDEWPEAVVQSLRTSYFAAFSRGARQLELATRLLGAFERAGLRALPMKGIALAETAYGSVAERPMGDIDLLALDDWDASIAILEAAGLEPRGRADHAWAFHDRSLGLDVELHHSLTSCPGLYRFDRDGLWERSRTTDGSVRRVPGNEDLLVQLCLHAAFQHGLVLSLSQYLDIRRVAERLVDVPRLAETSRTLGADPAVAAALAVGRAVAGAPLLANVPSRLSPWLERRLAEPERFLLGHPAAIARVRWSVARGRRLRLIAETLSPSEPGPRQPPWTIARRVASRIWGLARRWF